MARPNVKTYCQWMNVLYPYSHASWTYPIVSDEASEAAEAYPAMREFRSLQILNPMFFLLTFLW